MADEEEHGPHAWGLLVEPGARIDGRGVGGAGPLLALEVDLGITVLAVGRGIGVVSVAVASGGSSVAALGSDWPPGLSSGGVPSALGWKLFIEDQAFTSVPSTEK